MPNETRINLKHLLEDIRDTYACSVEEVIITELVANALDSGATRLEFSAESDKRILRCVDNGEGMSRDQLKSYHDIAASTKERGHGIGFAGIGAKLSLLVSESVVTETCGPHGSRGATYWHLISSNRAPWKFIPSNGFVTAPRGTAVQITFSSATSQLGDPQFVTSTILKHFYTLLDLEMWNQILRFIYPKGVEVFVNGQKVVVPNMKDRKFFKVHIGARNRRPIGIGYLMRCESTEIPFSGIAVSTYGKVIKNGWEWLGIQPKRYQEITGLVEIPGLAEILTTNKADFLSDAAGLKKYYRYRKAVQESILAVLAQMGESSEGESLTTSRELTSLSREIESALGTLVSDFPELESLVGIRSRTILSSASFSNEKLRVTHETDPIKTVCAENTVTSESVAVSHAEQIGHSIGEPSLVLTPSSNGDILKRTQKKGPKLKISYEAFTETSEPLPLGRMIEDTIWVNTAHPAWKKAVEENLEEYHVLLSVACILSQFLGERHTAHDFISRFLASWGQPLQKELL